MANLYSLTNVSDRLEPLKLDQGGLWFIVG